MAMRKQPLARWMWIAAGALLVIFLAVMAWPRAAQVDAATISTGEVRRDIVDEGRTRVRDVFIVAAPVGGALQRVTLDPGDPVHAGETVAVIMPADPALLDARISAEARAAIAAAEAAVRAAETDLALANTEHARILQLHETGFVSDAARDRAAAALDAARAAAALRKAELQRARAAAGQSAPRATTRTEVRSPVSGEVLVLHQQSETVIGPGMPILEIGDIADLEIVAEFLSQDAASVREGMTAYVEAWGGTDLIEARVHRVEPFARTKISALGVEEQRVNVIARLANPATAPRLGHGYRVDLRVRVLEQGGVLRVPVDALVRDGANWAVFRIESGRARFTPVSISEAGDRYRAIAGGLAEGDQVILYPGDTLRDGDRVAARR